jgi:hypothetical protein
MLVIWGVAGDRLLDAEEILHALVAFEVQLQAAASGSIPFSRFSRFFYSRMHICDYRCMH